MGLFDFLKKKNEPQKTEIPHEKPIAKQIKYQEPDPPRPRKKFVSIPHRIGDCVRSYYYPKVKFSPSSDAERLALTMQETGEWEVTLQQEDSKIVVYYHGDLLGELLEKEDMVKDWLKRNDPMFCALGNFGNSGNYLALAFYRDEQKRLSSRESTVVKLIRCTNEEAQLNLTGAEEGDKLDLEEDYEHEDSVVVLLDGAEIGALPKRQAAKYMEEGCAGVFLDHLDMDDNCRDIPYVKIFW